MEVLDIFLGIISIIIGYFLGSILPAYFFGRLKGIDLREEGTCNPGTSNAFKVLGLPYAIPTAVYDTLKGLLTILIAYYLCGNFIFMQISGLVAIVGHVFPFYLKFRGGQGNATATGLLLFYLINYISVGFEIFYILLYLILILVIFVYISKVGSLLPAVLFPLLGYSIFITYPESRFNIFFCIILFHIGIIGMYKVITEKKLIITDEIFKATWWRVAIRPFALLFLLFYFFYSKIVALIVIGIVCACFLALDWSRFLSKQANEILTVRIKSIFKKSEHKKLSSMTIFLASSFVTVLLFEIEVATTALVFLVFGDMFAKIFGLAYGRHKLFEKTVEGSLAYLGSVLIFGYILITSINISLIALIAGGITAIFSELLSSGVNDNLSVPLMSGTVMTVTILFGF